jgi:hypothetical protein
LKSSPDHQQEQKMRFSRVSDDAQNIDFRQKHNERVSYLLITRQHGLNALHILFEHAYDENVGDPKQKD